MNIIRRDVYVLTDRLKQPIDYLQGTNAIPIEFTFRDYDIPSGASVRVLVEKPSGHKRFEQVTSRKENVVTVIPDQQMTAEVGISEMQLEVAEGNNILATFIQPINIKRTRIPVESGSGSGFIEEILADAKEAADRANQISDTIEQKAQKGEFSATVNIGETVTGIPGTTASVSNSGTAQNAILDFTIPAGVKGDSGVMAPASGFFALWVDSETGNLYCDYTDEDTPPQFELDENGDLYMDIGGTA